MRSLYRCPICNRDADAFMRPCRSCQDEMTFSSAPLCIGCGIDLAGSDNPCPACRGIQSPLKDVFAVGPWSGALREWLSLLKFGGEKRLAEWPAEIFYRIIENKWPQAAVVPVPPRRRRIVYEGYDAVDAIADELSHKGIEVVKLLKRRGGKTQKTLSREERLKASALKFELRGSRMSHRGEVVLLDDVSTTGSTLRACADLMKQCGIEVIHALVFCKD